MSIFLVLFFILYGLLHLYVFTKINSALSLNTSSIALITLFMALMVFAPVIVFYLEKTGLELAARIASWSGYIWMGFLFLFICLSLLFDLYRLLLHLTGMVSDINILKLLPSSRLSFLLSIILSVSTNIYGYFEARDIRVENVRIMTEKIPEEIGRLKIAQISDVHLGLIVREGRLKKIIEKINNVTPDILVSTGDLVDGQINELSGFAEMFSKVNPRYGKFAITGNHEFYAGLDQAMDFTEKAGFKVLRGKIEKIDDVINIAGVDDSAGKRYQTYINASEKDLLADINNNNFTLLLKHRPVIDENSTGLFDLQLSGHTHKGQIFPFRFLTRLFYPLLSGYSKLQNGSHLYVSRGTGTWGPPVRLLTPPEVTVIELVKGD